MTAQGARGVLFVSHDATRTGAPIALLHFLRWFKKNSNRPFRILVGSAGGLIGEFEELAPTWSVDWSRWRPDSLRTQLLSKARLGEWARRVEAQKTRDFARKVSPALVYTNSIASAPVIDVLAPEVAVLTHVHELEAVFQKLASPALERLLKRTRQFIACSNAVRENLVCGRLATGKKVETIHESIPVDAVRPARGRDEILQELRFPGDAQVVVGAGTPSWRKGTDLFVQLARAVCRQNGRAHFLWVGGTTWDYEQEVRMCGLTGKVRLIDVTPKPADYLSLADVFVLTSREDPYPLVCLEAAALEKPIVCFADAGGAREFVEKDCGFVVPYLDVESMAEKIVRLVDDPSQRLAMGEAARRKVTERHDTGVAAPLIADIIERTIAAS